jgi:hypothetical protein
MSCKWCHFGTCLVVIASVLAMNRPAFAQSATGKISGVVVGDDGKLLAAVVTANKVGGFDWKCPGRDGLGWFIRSLWPSCWDVWTLRGGKGWWLSRSLRVVHHDFDSPSQRRAGCSQSAIDR